VKVTLVATFARPKSHLGTGRNAGVVKESAPVWHTTYPDGDKSARAVGDSLTEAGVIVDDAQIAVWLISKRWCDPGDRPGAEIIVEVLP
jgi:crossover junction endodeoxyribonuclease RusA